MQVEMEILKINAKKLRGQTYSQNRKGLFYSSYATNEVVNASGEDGHFPSDLNYGDVSSLYENDDQKGKLSTKQHFTFKFPQYLKD